MNGDDVQTRLVPRSRKEVPGLSPGVGWRGSPAHAKSGWSPWATALNKPGAMTIHHLSRPGAGRDGCNPGAQRRAGGQLAVFVCANAVGWMDSGPTTRPASPTCWSANRIAAHADPVAFAQSCAESAVEESLHLICCRRFRAQAVNVARERFHKQRPTRLEQQGLTQPRAQDGPRAVQRTAGLEASSRTPARGERGARRTRPSRVHRQPKATARSSSSRS